MPSPHRVGITSVLLAVIVTLIIAVAAVGFLLTGSSALSPASSTSISTGASSASVSSSISTTSSATGSSTNLINTTISTSLSTATECNSTTNLDTSATSTATGNLRCYGFVTFGAFYYAPPSGMLIPANTLVWTNFQYGQNVSLNLQAQVNIFAYADDSGTNLTIGIYGPNGSLLATSATSFPADVCQMSSPNCTNTPNGTANQIMPIPNSPLVDGFNVDAYNVSILQGSTFSVVFTASHAVWMEGWSFADRSGGTGAKYGQFAWEVPITYEASGQYTTLPALLPQASFTSSFEMGIWGRTTIQVPST